MHDHVFYKEDDMILDTLIRVIDSGKYLSTTQFSDFITKYEWARVILEYDKLFEELVR